MKRLNNKPSQLLHIQRILLLRVLFMDNHFVIHLRPAPRLTWLMNVYHNQEEC